ncbi:MULTISPECIES: hypothetical protein [unclassified Bacillus (in: firmicutes)]|uniref:hypothetical protein n=1 Tax=unclassified Bacillus (in: firmicutes) TaxID=185979 RepID=UPI0008DF5E84|nr:MULTISPECIES: hypothetical protein [unclassified Bacillus (in: firmicutes)]SFB08166.1 hypothetical protein SAMN02799634_105155 [Bacillus sp. UNCCL13]SFQ87141.1 hypothetical protein SAMN04488577_2966 [Bacillus sp. cl95]
MIKKVFLFSSMILCLLSSPIFSNVVGTTLFSYTVSYASGETDSHSNASANHDDAARPAVAASINPDNDHTANIPFPAYVLPGSIGIISILLMGSYWFIFRKRSMK